MKPLGNRLPRHGCPSDGRLAHLLAEQLVSSGTTLGEALLAAKQALADEGMRATDVLLGWTMMGDPALLVGGSG